MFCLACQGKKRELQSTNVLKIVLLTELNKKIYDKK